MGAVITGRGPRYPQRLHRPRTAALAPSIPHAAPSVSTSASAFPGIVPKGGGFREVLEGEEGGGGGGGGRGSEVGEGGGGVRPDPPLLLRSPSGPRRRQAEKF